MSNYVKAVDYSAKDALASGNPNKIIKGTELNDEFNAIATAIGTKADIASPVFLGNPSATTQPLGNNSTRLATTAFVQSEITDLEANVAITGGTIDGVAITNSTISSLSSPLEVASGGTGNSTLLANGVLLGNGTNAIQTIAPGTSGNVLSSNGTTWVSSTPAGGIGSGQTWQDVTASRVSGTTYTNSTSTPIQLAITTYKVGNSPTNFYIGGVRVGFTNAIGTNEVGNWTVSSFIVPVGSSYRVDGGFDLWVELR